ncbi:hypothetical protein NEPAR04_2383 [Nematocida parisii]|nr:hypothetical protein NEPAR08_1264 [Nematocida parisii]KAI5128460.1 hypothetical protein NEPAR03_1314 [Nematocida parisii]KAI5145237.1 hypothetical protein NEPAR04_2383 [Nematocida parisii]
MESTYEESAGKLAVQYSDDCCPPSPQSHIDFDETIIKKRRTKRRKTLPKYVVYKDLTEREETKLTPRQLLMIMKKKGIITDGIKELDRETTEIFPGVIPCRKNKKEENSVDSNEEMPEIAVAPEKRINDKKKTIADKTDKLQEVKEKESIKKKEKNSEMADISKNEEKSSIETVKTRICIEKGMVKKILEETSDVKVMAKEAEKGSSEEPLKHVNIKISPESPKLLKTIENKNNIIPEKSITEPPADIIKRVDPSRIIVKMRLLPSDNKIKHVNCSSVIIQVLQSIEETKYEVCAELLADMKREIAQHTCTIRPLLSSIIKRLSTVLERPGEHAHMATADALQKVVMTYKNITQNRKHCCIGQ